PRSLSRMQVCCRDRRSQRSRRIISAEYRMELCHRSDHDIPCSTGDRQRMFASDASGLSAKKPTNLPRSPMQIPVQEWRELAGRISGKVSRPRTGQIALTKANQLTDGFAIGERCSD